MVKVCNFKSLPCCRGNKHKIGCVATFPSLFLTLSLTNKMNNIYYALDMYSPFHMFLSLIFCRYFIYFHSDQVQTYLSYIRVFVWVYGQILHISYSGGEWRIFCPSTDFDEISSQSLSKKFTHLRYVSF